MDIRSTSRAQDRWTIAAAILVLQGVVAQFALADDEIRVSRQFAVSEHRATPYLIVPTPDGGYLIAGSNGLQDSYPWATRVDGQGARVWQLLDGPEDAWDVIKPSTNRFTGVVFLPDERILLCGRRNPEKEHSFSAGVLFFFKDSHNLKAIDVYKGDSSAIHTCFRWNDGVALVGDATKDEQSSGWVAKLDLQGNRVWSKTASFGIYLDAIATADQDLLVLSTTYAGQGSEAHLSKINQDGELVLDTTIPGGDVATFVRSSSPLQYPLKIVTTDRTLTNRLITVDKSLKTMAVQPIKKPFDVKRAAYLPDQSVVLFGSIQDRGATAAVGHVDLKGDVYVAAFTPLHQAFWISDAIPDGSLSRFVAITQIDAKPVLMWISFGK